MEVFLDISISTEKNESSTPPTLFAHLRSQRDFGGQANTKRGSRNQWI